METLVTFPMSYFSGALLMTVPSENKSYFRVLYSPDGSHVACGMSKAEVRILDSTTGAQVGRC